jgi:hypothetical protein
LNALGLALLVALLAAGAPPGASKQRPAPARKAAAPPPKRLAPEENPKLGGAAKAFSKARVRFEAPADRIELQPGEVTVRLAVSGYALVGGAHAHLIVDNQPALQVDDVSRALTLKNVPAGPHLLRAVLCRPWHEVVKAPHAFASTRFWSGPREPGRPGAAAEREVWPDPKRPLLTYVLPLGDPRPGDAKLEVAAPPSPATTAMTVNTASAPSTDPNLGGNTTESSEPPPPPPPPPAAAATAPAVQHRPRPPSLDFYLSNAKLGRRSYKVRVVLDRAELQLVKSWEPTRLPRLRPGRHRITIDLLDRRALEVPGPVNRTDRAFHTP